MSRNSLPPAEIRDRKRIGAILRMARERKGYSVDEVAGWFPKSRAFLANIEAGRKSMPAYMLPILCMRLEVDPIVFDKTGAMPVEAAA